MSVFRYVNKKDSVVTLAGHVFKALGDLKFTATRPELDALNGISLDKYIDEVPIQTGFSLVDHKIPNATIAVKVPDVVHTSKFVKI